jgi:hypothetical protein
MGICMKKFTWHNPKGFVVEGKECMGCCLQKSIYGLKQATRWWYLKLKSQLESLGLKRMRGQLYLCKVQEWKIHFPNPVYG